MKKLMILALVLSMASVASAVVEYVGGADGDFAFIEGYHATGDEYLYNASSMYIHNHMVDDGAGGLEYGSNNSIGLVKWDLSGVTATAAQITSATVSWDEDGVQHREIDGTLRGYDLQSDFNADGSSEKMSNWGAALYGVKGTDYSSTASLSYVVAAGNTTANGPMSFDITSLVQDWITNGGVTGMALVFDDSTEVGKVGTKIHAGGDFVSPGGGQMRPYLTITSVPEPMTIALLGLGGLFLRRKK